MGYYVIMDEIEQAEQEIVTKLFAWAQQLNEVLTTMTEYTQNLRSNTSGQITESACCYLEQIHGDLINRLELLLQEMYQRIAGYLYEYFNIEEDVKGVIAQESLEEQKEVLLAGKTAFEGQADNLKAALDEVSDIVSLIEPDRETLTDGFELMTDEVEKLRTAIGEHEATHLENDFTILEEMEEALSSLIESYRGKGQIKLENYQSWEFLNNENVKELINLEAQQNNYMISHAEELNQTMAACANRVQAREKETQGIAQMKKGGGIIVGAVAVVVAVCVASTPAGLLITGAGKVTTVVIAGVSGTYGIGELSEGFNNWSQGRAGDGTTIAKNIVRDTLFVECPELYYLLGEASTAIVAVEGTGMLLVNAGMTGGVAGVIYEGGRLVLTVEGTKLVSEGLRDAGASEGVIFLTEIATMTAIYGGIGLIKKSVAGRITATKGGTDVWDMTEGGGIINGREYSQHAMERMAPDTPSVRAELSRRAEALAESKGLQVGTPEYYQFCQKYVDPRNIPPSVIEDAIRNTTAVPGHTAGTFVHQTADVTVIVNEAGKVITVIPK